MSWVVYRSSRAPKTEHYNDVLVISNSWEDHAKPEISDLGSINRFFYSARAFEARRKVLKLWDQLLLHRCCPSFWRRSWQSYNPRQKSLKHLCTSLSACNVEMLLQSCVATTTLQKGGGKQKGAEFSKVFQGFCLRLSEVAGNFRSMRKKCQIRL